MGSPEIEWWLKLTWWVSFLRDVGIILGFPTLIGIGIYFFMRHISVLKDQINFLKETQYDKALSLIKAQKELFDIEREKLQEKIDALEADQGAKEVLKTEVSNAFIALEASTSAATLGASGAYFTTFPWEKEEAEKSRQRLAKLKSIFEQGVEIEKKE